MNNSKRFMSDGSAPRWQRSCISLDAAVKDILKGKGFDVLS